MNWRKLFPFIFLFTCVDGFISNWAYPRLLPLLYRDFLILGVYVIFLSHEPVGRWAGQLRKQVGPKAWFFAVFFLFIGVMQMFNPLSSGVLLGLLGIKILFFYWPLAVLAYAYAENPEKVRQLFKAIVYFSVPINLFGLYQFWKGPEYLVATFGQGFARATITAFIPGLTPDESFLRVIGTFASSGQFTAFLLINAMLCFALLFSAHERRERFTCYGCAALNFLALLASGSRGGILALILQVILYAILCRRIRRVLAVTILVGLSLYIGFGLLGKKVTARFETVGDIGMIRHRTSETTMAMFVETLDKYPSGRGLGTASQPARHLLGENSSGWEMVENYLSKMQMETGILGVISFYLFLAALGIRWYRRWQRPLKGLFLDLASPITAYCLTQFIISGLFGSLDSAPQSVFLWTFVGLAARIPVLSTLRPRSGLIPSGVEVSKTIQQKVPARE